MSSWNIGAKLGVVPTTMTLARCRAPNFTVMVRKARVLTWAVCGRPASRIRRKSSQVSSGRLSAWMKSLCDWMMPSRSTTNTSGASRMTLSFT